MKKKRAFAALLAAALCLGTLTAPATATEKQAPEIDITWLSVEGKPHHYLPELDWLVIDYGGGYVMDLSTGTLTEYDNAGYDNSDGLVWAEKRDEDGYRNYDYIDNTGKVVISTGDSYNEVWDFSDGMASVRNHSEPRYSYINKTGEVVFSLQQGGARDFHEGLAAAWQEGVDLYGDECSKYGFIDKTGAVVTPLEYDEVSDFSEGMAWVKQTVWDYEEDDEMWYYGIIDQTGNLVTAMEYFRAGTPSEGLIWVAGNTGYGFLDNTGKVVIPLQYSETGNFSEGLVWVKDSTGKCGFIDKTGAVVVPLQYDSVGDFSDGIAWVCRDYKYGFVDANSNLVVPIDYDKVGDFSEGLAWVMKLDANGNEKYGVINKNGETVVPLEYDYVSSFYGGLAGVMKYAAEGNPKYGFINKGGEIVLPLEYDGTGLVQYDKDTYSTEMRVYNGVIGMVQKGSSYGVFKNPYWTKNSDTSGGGESVGNVSDSGASGGSTSGSSTSDSDTSDEFPVVPVVISGGAAVSVLAVVAVFVKKVALALTACLYRDCNKR